MARQRIIKPEFFRDRKIAKMGPIPALVYQALWITADDGGNAPAAPDLLKGEMFARWALTTSDIALATVALHEASMSLMYSNGDELFAHLPNFAKHQKINNPSKFRHDLGEPVSDVIAALSEWLPKDEKEQPTVALHEASSPNTITNTNTIPNTIQITNSSDSKKKRKPKPDHSEHFAAFWNAYPKKVGKLKAIQKYDIAVTRVDQNGADPHAVILQAVERYAVSAKTKESRFILNPETWLNQGRWMDVERDESHVNTAPMSEGDRILEEIRKKNKEDAHNAQP